MEPNTPITEQAEEKRKRRQKPNGRQNLRCPVHPSEKITGNGKKYFLHLVTQKELEERGMPSRKARLVISAYPVLTLSNEWLESLYCAECGQSQWYHLIKREGKHVIAKLATRDLWGQVAHVDPEAANPSVSEHSRREARRYTNNKKYYD